MNVESRTVFLDVEFVCMGWRGGGVLGLPGGWINLEIWIKDRESV